VVISIKEFDVMAHLEDKWPWASAEIFPGWATLTLCYPFQVDNYSMQMDVHKTLYPLCTTKKMRYVTATVTKNVLRSQQCFFSHGLKLRGLPSSAVTCITCQRCLHSI